jgi:excinuclease ABC subunit C
MSTPESSTNPAALPPAEKVKQFPAAPGVYIMKDAQGVVLYVGKAKNLRNRAGHYFTKAAADDPRTSDLVPLIADIDYLSADSE